MRENPLGRKIEPPKKYSPELLHPIPREPVDGSAYSIMHGLDHWRAYELSWLDNDGKPAVFIGEFIFPADSPFMVESKSLKLYLAGLNQTRFKSREEVAELIRTDLSACCRAPMEARVWGLMSYPDDCRLASFQEIDHHPLPQVAAEPDSRLPATRRKRVSNRKIRSELFRCVCPITGQPDWASIAIDYSGSEIPEENLLSCLCSYRERAAWHEQCAEMVFHDIMRCWEPEQLSLSLHFLRRGGLEINVYRSTSALTTADLLGRDARQ